MNLLSLLSDGEFHSGDDLGAALGISRAAIWKQVQRIQTEKGIDIHSVKGKGYRLASPLELLSAEDIIGRLSVSTKPSITNVECLGTIGSTNDVAMRHAESGGEPGYVCVAEQQTAGRGRRGRTWVSPFGRNIYMSIVWDFYKGAAALEGLSLAVGVVVAEALERQGVSNVELKWPNDVLIGGAKLGGILLEMTGDPSGHCQVVIGIGINIEVPDKDAESIDQSWIDTRSLGVRIGRNELVASVLEGLVGMLPSFSSIGFLCVKDRWSSLDAFKDRDVMVKMGREDVFGVATGVDDTGSLLLRVGDCTQVIKGGEVSLRLRS